MRVVLMLAAALAGQTPPVPQGEIGQEPPGFAAGPGNMHGPTRDRDGDGVVTVAEFTSAQTEAFDFLDRNQDGKLSPEEFAEGRSAAMAVLGGDAGPLGPDPRGRGPGHFRLPVGGPDGDMPPPPPPPRFGFQAGRPGSLAEGAGDLDADHDGKISLEEFETPLHEAFSRMDTDHSGFIEAAEKDEGPNGHVVRPRTAEPAD